MYSVGTTGDHPAPSLLTLRISSMNVLDHRNVMSNFGECPTSGFFGMAHFVATVWVEVVMNWPRVEVVVPTPDWDSMEFLKNFFDDPS